MIEEYAGFRIFFKDLNEEVQKRFLDSMGVKDKSELYFDVDVFPIIAFSRPKKEPYFPKPLRTRSGRYKWENRSNDNL